MLNFCTMFSLVRMIESSDLASESWQIAYQHVHHAHALRMLEHARLALMERAGFPISRFIEQGLLLVIARVEVRYLRELVQGEVTITCSNPQIKRKAVVLEQCVLNSRGKHAVEAIVESVFIDSETRRAVYPPSEFVEAIRNLTLELC